MKVKLHSQPPTTTTYYYWKKNVRKIHKFQQKANPDENERLSDVLSLIPSNGLFINIKIGINGFGLLGRHIFRCALEEGIQVVAINGDLYRYHCSFEPAVEMSEIRRETLSKAGIKDVAFDGTRLYSFEDFGPEKIVSGHYLLTNELVTIKLKRTATASPEFFHLANLIGRKLPEIAGFKLLGRNYSSFEKRIELDRYKSTFFPAFMTAVNASEGQLMINVDLSTKVMNKQTVYSILMDKFNRLNDAKQAQDALLKEQDANLVELDNAAQTPRTLY